MVENMICMKTGAGTTAGEMMPRVREGVLSRMHACVHCERDVRKDEGPIPMVKHTFAERGCDTATKELGTQL